MSSFKEIDTKVEGLMKQAFEQPRGARSTAYKHGVRAALWNRFCTSRSIMSQCFYEPGTAEFDAFIAGVDEGRAIATRAEAAKLVDALQGVAHAH